MNGGAVWGVLADRATLSGIDVDGMPRSELLDRLVDEMLERLLSNGRFSWCGHLSSVVRGELPDMVAFPGDAYGACPPCARLWRDEMQRARRRTCLGCDSARATALHKAVLGAVPGMAYVTLAVPLCEVCAESEGLRSVDPVASS